MQNVNQLGLVIRVFPLALGASRDYLLDRLHIASIHYDFQVFFALKSIWPAL